MRRAFTLIELLVVMGIIGLLGTISVGGYRAMQRGMEERGVMQNVNSLIRSAYQRAQIDRQPVAVYFWNETLRSRSADENEIVIGKAVAVRRAGRLTRVVGSMLVDEFGDLDQTYPTEDDESGNGSQQSLMYLYPMEKLSDMQSGSNLKRSSVRTRVEDASDGVQFLGGPKSDPTADSLIPAWAFHVEKPGGVQWKPGMSYGFEFLHIELPHNYVFGTDYSTSVENPIREAGTLVFKVGINRGDGLTKGGTYGRNSIQVSSLRQSGADLRAEAVGTTDNPEKDL